MKPPLGQIDQRNTTDDMHWGNGLRFKVLLVDKDHQVRAIIKRCLSDACEIADVRDGGHGARWLRSERVDLAIVDVKTTGSYAMLRALSRLAQIHQVPLVLVESGEGTDSRIKKLGVFKVVKTVLAFLTLLPSPAVVRAPTLDRAIDLDVVAEAS